jgi:glucose/arabinose dehydrogenase
VIGDTVGQVWARGLQRVTALSVNPQTGELWAADAGRGDLGADVPTGELNILSRGRHYGWPYCHGPRVPAPEYSDPRRCDATERPVHLLPAGSAPAGLLLYAGDAFPASYRGDAFVALTGPAPRIGRLRLAAGRPAVLERFVSGWADAGYPQTLAVAPDGSLYVTDPRGGRIWRVFYTGESRQP